MSRDELTLKAISTHNGNLHNGMTAALEAVVAMVLEEAAGVVEGMIADELGIAAAIRDLKGKNS